MNDNIQSIIDSGGKRSYNEYRAACDEINKKSKGNVLIFGVGHESKLFADINKSGLTLFIEDNPKRAITLEKEGYDVVRVAYESAKLDRNQVEDVDKLKMFFPSFIFNTDWNIIFINLPADSAKGIMKAIYNAFLLATKAEKRKWTTVFVSDFDKVTEKKYVNHFFKEHKIETIDNMAKVICRK